MNVNTLRPFHLAIAVDDLPKAKTFYHEVLGCPLGRTSEHWIDFDFYGHQLVTHFSPNDVSRVKDNDVDGKKVPSRHFGIILTWDQWENLRDRLVKEPSINFIIEPCIRFKDKAGEQATMFFLDPCGNALEFKAFKDDSMIFAT